MFALLRAWAMSVARGCSRRRSPQPTRREGRGGPMQSTTQSTAGRRLMPFDAHKLSASGESLTGEVDAADLPRVADRLAIDAGAARLVWRLMGMRDGQGRPALTLT